MINQVIDDILYLFSITETRLIIALLAATVIAIIIRR